LPIDCFVPQQLRWECVQYRFLPEPLQQAIYIQFGFQVFGIGFIVFVGSVLKSSGRVVEYFPFFIIVFQCGQALYPIARIEV
jgi:hypothetical protein